MRPSAVPIRAFCLFPLLLTLHPVVVQTHQAVTQHLTEERASASGDPRWNGAAARTGLESTSRQRHSAHAVSR